jgi:hypothetical protein
MGIFTTREIAIFIYGILLLAYVLVRKKGKDILLPIIKAACHIKLIIPFCVVLLFAAGFVWVCTYLPFWDWIYVKDIVFWVLFAGVPVCFNATNRQLEEHYFRNILIDNLKFTALVEFVTGTFTFPIIGELMLQPILVFFVILESSLVKKTETTKKVVDGLIGIAGLIIIGLTIKSMVASIGEIYFVDILVGLVLPIVLSIIYLPVAYFFALYAKYELLFLRMGFKETDDKKLKISHRIKVLHLCNLSYKKVCKFLYEYLPKMYVRMSAAEFENILDEFRGTTEHTYIALIRHDSKYYISRRFTEDSFAFPEYTVKKGGLFNTRNKALRKEIALQIQGNTPFQNTEFNDSNLHYPVSLHKFFLFNKGAFFKRTKVALFISNSFERRTDSVDLPFDEGVREQSNQNAIALMRAIKRYDYWPSFIMVLVCFAIFLLLSFKQTDLKVNLDFAALVYTILFELRVFFTKRNPLLKMKIKGRIIYIYVAVVFKGIQEVLVFGISLLISYTLRFINFPSEWLSKFSIAILFLCILIDLCKKEQ